MHLSSVDSILARHGDAASPFQMCPPQLFTDIIRINNLRMLAATSGQRAQHLSLAAFEALDLVAAFSPEQWANSKDSSVEDWTLMGRAYQAAVSLYCIMSLQSLSVLPRSATIRNAHAEHTRQLHTLLAAKGIGLLSSPRTRRFMLWPLVVLGVAVAGKELNCSSELRDFVALSLEELSLSLSTRVPLTARGALESFWASNSTRWDDCFNRPYVFTAQIAVDSGHLSSVG